jgi:hypothetical protein
MTNLAPCLTVEQTHGARVRAAQDEARNTGAALGLALGLASQLRCRHRLQVQYMTHVRFTSLLGAENDAQLAYRRIADIDLNADEARIIFGGFYLEGHFDRL